ncbi:MAG: hypothetical protein DBY16_05905 [Coprobacter sp.]|nr:hypothetical protein [Bacteroidales bacterium]PWM91187.1 MAG: hypothetical protein DBY16_05905 [Coprobacter sp.]
MNTKVRFLFHNRPIICKDLHIIRCNNDIANIESLFQARDTSSTDMMTKITDSEQTCLPTREIGILFSDFDTCREKASP